MLYKEYEIIYSKISRLGKLKLYLIFKSSFAIWEYFSYFQDYF